MSHRILVLEGITERGAEILRAEGWTVDMEKALPPAELVKLVPPYDAILVRSGSQMNAEVIDAAKNLKVIGRAGVGVDNVDLAAATRRGVLVMNSPGGNTVSTAELAVGLMLALARNLAPADLAMKGEKWDRKSFAGVELFGKRLGVIGFGRIGREVAARCRAFGMEVQAFDPFVSPAVAEQAHVKLRSLEEVLQTSDYLTLHTTLTKETKHLLGKDAFAEGEGGRPHRERRPRRADRRRRAPRRPRERPRGRGRPRRPRAGAAQGLASREAPEGPRPAAPRGLDEGSPGAGGHGHRAAGARLPEGRRHPVGRELLLAGRRPLRPGPARHGPRASGSGSSSPRPATARSSGSSWASTATCPSST